MRLKWAFVLNLTIAGILMVGCSTAPTPTATPTSEPTTAAVKALVLATVASDPAKTIDAFQPLADYLAANLSQFGITEGQVKVAPDLDTLARWLKSGDVDLFFDSVYPVMIMADTTGAKPILRRWKSGIAEYNTVFIANISSGINTIQDLKGHTVGMDSDASTSAYMLPRAYLADAGIKTVLQSTPDAQVTKDEIGYVFTHSDENTIQWVLSGKVAAGAIGLQVYNDIPEADRKNMTIVAQTEKLPRAMAAVRSTLAPEMVDAIKNLLIGINQTDEGKAILVKFEKTARFDEFPGGADTALARIRQLYDLVKSG
ncbi:MAG: phosphate/phosphite/phosphonate ABC transporter substrate-binding protein [Chloroflexota bacterium]